MVPLNESFLILDLIKMIDAEVILVYRSYLGSINHTLITIEVLKNHEIPLKGMIFNDTQVISSENFITKYSGIKALFHIDQEKNIQRKTILKYSTNQKIINQLI